MSAHPTINPTIATLALALLLGLQPLTTDMYLPAMPAIAAGLHGSAGEVQYTLSILILVFGLAQLLWGPVADRFGRRPVLRAGLSVFLIGAVGAAAAGGMGWLIAMRVLQGVGLASAVVCARAMVRDLYPPHEGGSIMSKALSGLGVLAVCCPALGGALTMALGWRANFVFLALAAMGYLWFLWRHVPETAPALNPRALHPLPLLRSWLRIIRHPGFLAYAGLSAATYGGLLIFLAGSSFVYGGVLGLSPTGCGLVLASNSLAYILGTLLCRRWLPRLGMPGAVRRAGWFTLVGGLGMAAVTWAGVASVWTLLPGQWLYALGHGLHQPCGQAGAVGPFPREAGTASAVAGFLLAAVGFSVGSWLSFALDGTVRPLAYGVAVAAIITTSIAWTLVQRHGTPAAE